MPAALKSIALSGSFCSEQPAQPRQNGKKLKLDSNFRIENWHWAEMNWSEAMHFVWSLVTTRGVIIDQSEARIVTPGPIRSRDSDHISTDVIGTKNGPTWILTVDHYQSCLEPDIFTITGRISGLIITENNGECFIL